MALQVACGTWYGVQWDQLLGKSPWDAPLDVVQILGFFNHTIGAVAQGEVSLGTLGVGWVSMGCCVLGCLSILFFTVGK